MLFDLVPKRQSSKLHKQTYRTKKVNETDMNNILLFWYMFVYDLLLFPYACSLYFTTFLVHKSLLSKSKDTFD